MGIKKIKKPLEYIKLGEINVCVLLPELLKLRKELGQTNCSVPPLVAHKSLG